MTRATLIALAAVVTVTFCGGLPARRAPVQCCQAIETRTDEGSTRDAMLARLVVLNAKAARIEARLKGK